MGNINIFYEDTSSVQRQHYCLQPEPRGSSSSMPTIIPGMQSAMPVSSSGSTLCVTSWLASTCMVTAASLQMLWEPLCAGSASGAGIFWSGPILVCARSTTLCKQEQVVVDKKLDVQEGRHSCVC